MDGVFGQMRVGNMTLHPLDRELAAHGPAATIFDHVTGALDRGGFTHNAIVQHLTARLQQLAHHHGAVECRALFVAG